MTIVAEVLTQDRSTGHVHKRIEVEGSHELMTYEGCNLDSAGEFDVIGSVEDVEPDRLCQRCFPPQP